MAGPHRARRGITSQRTTTLSGDALIEQQIMDIYEKSPVVAKGETYYYQPSSTQEQQIISLAQKLSPKKQTQYITYPPEEPKGIGETLAGITIEPIIGQITSWLTGTPIEKVRQVQEFQKKAMPPSLKPKEPVQFVGGVVSSVEAPVYTVGKLAGIKTPRIPPTISGGVIGSVLGDPTELTKIREYGPEYAKGTVLGDLIVSYAIGKGLEKAWSLTPQVIKKPIQYQAKFGPLAKAGHKIKVHLPKFRGSRVDVWLAKRSKAYFGATRGIARGEVAIPKAPNISHLYKVKPDLLWKLQKPSELAWKLTLAPRTGGVWLGKGIEGLTSTKAPMRHLIYHAGKLSVGYLRDLSFRKPETGLTPFVSQTQLTRMGIHPYRPSLPSSIIKGSSAISKVVGTGLTTIPKLFPKTPVRPIIRERTFARTRIAYNPLEAFDTKMKQKQRQFIAPVQGLRQLQETKQKLKLQAISLHRASFPELVTVKTRPYPTLPSINLRGFVFGSRKKKKRGAWFFRKHPVASPKQLRSSLIGRRGKDPLADFNKKLKRVL